MFAAESLWQRLGYLNYWSAVNAAHQNVVKRTIVIVKAMIPNLNLVYKNSSTNFVVKTSFTNLEVALVTMQGNPEVHKVTNQK